MTPLALGSVAPSFSLTHRIGEDPISLDSFQGRPVVLLFFPLAFSGVCTEEMCAVSEDYTRYEELGAAVLGISIDSPFVNARFAEECGAPFPILSDFNREAATAYGIRDDDFFGMKGVAKRSAFVVDASGQIAYAWVTDDPNVMPDFDEVAKAVANAN